MYPRRVASKPAGPVADPLIYLSPGDYTGAEPSPIDSLVVQGAICASELTFGGRVVPDVYVRTLIRAAEIVGGAQELAFRLKVTPSHLSLWMAGLEACPGHVFLQAVDLVLERELPAAPAAVEPSTVDPARP